MYSMWGSPEARMANLGERKRATHIPTRRYTPFQVLTNPPPVRGGWHETKPYIGILEAIIEMDLVQTTNQRLVEFSL